MKPLSKNIIATLKLLYKSAKMYPVMYATLYAIIYMVRQPIIYYSNAEDFMLLPYLRNLELYGNLVKHKN